MQICVQHSIYSIFIAPLHKEKIILVEEDIKIALLKTQAFLTKSVLNFQLWWQCIVITDYGYDDDNNDYEDMGATVIMIDTLTMMTITIKFFSSSLSPWAN